MADAPGQLLDLSRWRLLLPDGPRVVEPPALAGFSHPSLFYAGIDRLAWLRAPVDADPDEAGTVGTELAQLDEPWQLDDYDDHVLTAVMLADPSGVGECVVGEIHADPVAPLQLVVTHAGHPGALVAVKAGEVVGPLLTGLRSDTELCWRITVTGGPGARRCYLYAGLGSSLPVAPVYSWPVQEFPEVPEGCRFRVGPRLPESPDGTGAAVVRLGVLSLI